MPAEVLEAPKQEQQVKQEPIKGSSMREAFAAAHAKSIAAGGIEGVVTPAQKAAADKALQESQQKQEIKKEPDVKAKEEVKKEEVKSDTTPITGMFDKLKAGIEAETKKEEVKIDPSTLTKEEKAENSYKKLRQERDTFEKELKEIRDKVGDADVPALKKQLADIEKIAAEREQKLAAIDVIESPQFRENVSIPCETILKELSDSSKKFGFSWKEFVNAVEEQTPDEREVKLDKLFSAAENEMPNVTKLKLFSRVNEYLQRQEYGQKIIANSKSANEILKANKAREEQESKDKSQSESKRVSELVLKHITSEEYLPDLPFLTKEVDGKRVLDDSKIALVRKELESQEQEPIHMKALRVISRELLPMALEENKSLRVSKVELEERIAKLTNSSPSIEQSKQEEEVKDDGLSIADRLKKIRTGR